MTAQWKASDFAADSERMASDHFMQAKTYADAGWLMSAATHEHKGQRAMAAASKWRELARQLGEVE